MAITTFADISAVVPQIYERALFVAREQNLMAQLVDHKSAKGWMARVITERPKVTAESVPDGVDYQNPQTFGKNAIATLTPGEVIAQVVITDQALESDPDGARDDASVELGNAIAEKIDQDLASTFANFTRDKGPGNTTDAGLSSVAAAIAVLQTSHAPGRKYVVLHPYQWHTIWLALGQPVANQAFLGDLANQALRDYFVAGPLIGATWFVSTHVPYDQAGTAATGAVFVPKAIVLDTRRPPRLEAERNASLRGWELNMTAGYAYGIQKDQYGIAYTSRAAEPS